MKCDECTLSGDKVHWYVPSITQYPLLVVGQAPGRTEEVTGVPFTGSAGKMLYSLMKGAGLNKSQLAQTNIVMCKPPDDGKGNDRAPTTNEIHCCFRHLYEEIQSFKPELILALGGPAIHALTGMEGPLTQRGSLHPLADIYQHECQVLCLLHPAFVMRQRQWINIAINDLQQVHKFFLGQLQPKVEYDFILDPTRQELLEYLYNECQLPAAVTAFDIETTSLDPFEAQVLGIGFSNSSNSAVAVYFTENDDRIPLIKDFLQSSDCPKVAQNGSYDCKVLEVAMNIKVQGMVHDTRLAEQILNSDMPKNLDHLRATYTQIKAYKPSKKEMKNIASWSKDRMLEYCCWDNVTTLQVMEAQQKLLTQEQKTLHEGVLVPLIHAINYMEIKGVKVDVPRLALMYAATIPKANALEQEIIGTYGLNPSSPKQVKEYFNTNSADRQTLESLSEKNPEAKELIDKILMYRDLTKGAGTFLRGVYDRLKGDRIHTQYNIEGTGTGRLSSEDPNLQNVPKPFRIIYIADDEDSVLISCDFKQLELWVVSLLAPCDVMINDLRSGVDIHAEVLEKCRPYIPERLQWNARIVAKTVVFGTIYGRSPRSIAIAFGVPISTAEEWQRISFGRYPGLQKYYEERREDFNKRRYVDTPFGRRRYIQTFPQALNAPVQSTAADIVLSKLNQCFYDKHLDIRLQVHDEIVIHSSLKNLDEDMKTFKEVMEAPVPKVFNNSFPVTMKIGYNWYEMKKPEEFLNDRFNNV